MRPHASLVHSRTRVTNRYALMPLEGYPYSRIPSWNDAQVRVLSSPPLSKFAQYLIDLPAGKRGTFEGQDQIETFFYVLSGAGTVGKAEIRTGSFGLLAPGKPGGFTAETDLSLLVLQKRYQASPGIETFTSLISHESDVTSSAWAGTDKIQLQLLIPDELPFDMAMNIFTFAPGFGLPIVETHVMEHGLLFLQGKGLYKLGDDWMEVEKDDFIWMGPYCPQSFYATGETPSRYIYYKDVNREMVL